MKFRVAIIGAGLIGYKRAKSISKNVYSEIKVIVDIDQNKAMRLAKEVGCEFDKDWKKVIERKDIDIVVVSTINKYLMPITVAALESRKHVLCEKPLGRNSKEAKLMVEASLKNGRVLKTGFNHRHHPAIFQAKQLFDKEEIGELIFMRCRYGHGGRKGYEKEWRADKELCGGGELLDQGVHVVDLFRWFGGEFTEVFGWAETLFWNIQVEDNAFALFRNEKGVIASMHTSWTQWKNLFSFEIFGKQGYLIIEGLGGNYGIETLKIGRRKELGKPPEEEIIKFEGEDISWEKEWEEFILAILQEREPLGNAFDGYMANLMIEAVYKASKEKRVVKINE